MWNGIDVSKYQSTIDWKKVKDAGIDFAMIRAGYGNAAAQKDPLFDANVTGALAQGLHAGAYWFSYAVDEADAKKEASVFTEILAPYKGKLEYPAALDYEKASMDYFKKEKGASPSIALIDSIADSFLSAMKNAGWYPCLYTNLDFINTGRFSATTRAKYDVWLADYTGGADYPYAIRQTSDAGTVSGISGKADLDISSKDYPALVRAGGYNGFTAIQIDTTMDVERPKGSVYTFKTTAKATPAVSVGTSGVAALMHCRREGNNDFWHLFFLGEPGAETGIYTAAPGEKPLIRFKARVEGPK